MRRSTRRLSIAPINSFQKISEATRFRGCFIMASSSTAVMNMVEMDPEAPAGVIDAGHPPNMSERDGGLRRQTPQPV
jgi:hypothetical protein